MDVPLNILLADDDKDDSFFFEEALKSLQMPYKLVTVKDGEKLMAYLSDHIATLPDLLFLDLNMPRKNGAECLSLIKHNKKLLPLPIIIYSTSLNKDVVDLFYQNGAHYYMHKTGLKELRHSLNHILKLIMEHKFTSPARDEFILNS